jgi:hypothetical protein
MGVIRILSYDFGEHSFHDRLYLHKIMNPHSDTSERREQVRATCLSIQILLSDTLETREQVHDMYLIIQVSDPDTLGMQEHKHDTSSTMFLPRFDFLGRRGQNSLPTRYLPPYDSLEATEKSHSTSQLLPMTHLISRCTR